MVLIELAVDSFSAAQAAAIGGADRIELCADLDVGGLTPSDDLTRRVLGDVDIPIFPMIRPRAGDFVYSAVEVADMCRTIERMRSLGVHGVVAGALTHSNEIDLDATRHLLDAAAGIPFTFHRAFDRVPDQATALEQLVGLGVTRILTSGGAPSATQGAEQLRTLVRQAAGRLTILAGAGLRESNVREVVLQSGVAEVHSRLTGPTGEEPSAERVRGFVEIARGHSSHL